MRLVSRIGTLLLCLASMAVAAETIDPPKSSDPSAKISLFASEPQIVTPIGATVDSKGRLLVIESQSHFRPKNYEGPPTDRIRILEDTKGDGKADRITSFYEGTNLMMNLAADKDGSIVVSSRNEIFRLAQNADGTAGQRTTLAKLLTKSDYPHDGLHGLTIGPDSTIYFGIGENFGQPWTLEGTDGRQLSEFRGSGTIFRMDGEGHNLTRVAHGFWNPFGLGVDPAGQLWAVDNDPDGRPPSRLIQVAPGGDYGFEFRYGRTGLHPLQAWDGELPGTLGMVAGVGEAPCNVRWFRGGMIVSSWRDHLVQSFTLIPHGASYTATVKPLLSGGENFRPVGLAVDKAGTLYVTDWGSASYQINGKGRVWKVTFSEPAAERPFELTAAIKRAQHLRESKDMAELLAAMNDSDPAIAQAAQYGFSQLLATQKMPAIINLSANQRIGILAAWLWRGDDIGGLIGDFLKDPDDRVRQMAVRAITEQGITSAKDQLQHMLESQAMSPRLLAMTVATINQLNGDPSAKIDSSKINGVLLSRINAPGATDQTRATALRMLQAGHPHIPLDEIRPLLDSASVPLQLEAVRYLNADSDPKRFDLLAEVATDSKRDVGVRAEAILGLADDATARVDTLLHLAGDSNSALRQEALRSLRTIAPMLTEAQKNELSRVAKEHSQDADLVQRLLGRPPAERPPETDTAAWQKIVDQVPGDPDAGRRIFFHPAGPGCYRCHMIEGRGHVIGPDLTMIGHSQTREHVLESILQPSKEIAPLFTLWTLTTKSGKRIDGMLLRRDGQENEVYVDASGTETKVNEKDVIDRKMRSESLMPSGLAAGSTDQELRDVVAFLMEKR
jgi:hypothetical protein